MISLDEQLKKVHDQLFDLPEVKLYFSLRDQISENAYLQTLLKQIRLHQKAMTAAMEDIKLYQVEKDIYTQLMHEYQSYPLIVNYEQIKEKVYLLLQQIQQIIE